MIRKSLLIKGGRIYFSLIFIILILSLISVIQAAPPFQTSISTSGLEIAGVDFTSIKMLTQRTAVANVYNATSGMPITSGVSCQFQVFSVTDTGSLIFMNNTPRQVGNTFYFSIPNNVYNITSEYTRIIQCNTSTVGGFYKSTFLATPNGEDPSTSNATFYYGIIFLFALVLAGCLYLSIKMKKPWQKILFTCIAYLSFVIITFVIWQVCVNFISGISFIPTITFLIWIISMACFFPFIIIISLYILDLGRKELEVNTKMNMGYTEDEARNGMR
jgi:hypothetical protein